MTENVGYAALQVIPSFKGFDSALERGVSGPFASAGTTQGARFGDAAGKSAGRRFGGIFTTAAKASLVGLAGVGAVAFKVGKDSIAAASDLNESLNAVNVTYGKQAAEVKNLGREAADALGLSNTEFNGLAVQFAGFAGTVAGKGGDVVGVLDDLATRGADFASVMNLEVNEAMGLFQSGLAGETEPLRKFGIDLSAAAVEAYALSEGIAKPTKNLVEIKDAQLDAAEAQAKYNEALREHGEKSLETQRASLELKDAQDALKEATKGSVGELTEAEKVQARYRLLMEKTSKTQGDFANTSDSLANRQRILNARWDDAKASLGTALLPIVEDFTGYLLSDGLPAVERFGDWFTETGGPALKDFAGFAGDAASAVGDVVGFLNDMPSEAKIAALAGVLGGGAYMKLRGGGSGALGSVGSAIGLAKPVPVFVTNPGFGGVPGGGAAGTAKRGGSLARNAARLAGPALLADAGYETFFGDLYGTRDQSNVSKQMNDPEGFGRLGTPRVLDDTEFTSSFGELVKSAVDSANDINAAFTELPKELTTQIALEGVPESKAAARDLVKQYDLTPKQKQTLFQLLGFDTVMRQASLINRELDWASRPRQARITVTRAYAGAGYETRGGLQQGGGTTTTQTGNGGRSAQRTYDAERRFDRRMNDRD